VKLESCICVAFFGELHIYVIELVELQDLRVRFVGELHLCYKC
jgi:hypothetical protein